jgi:membrane protein
MGRTLQAHSEETAADNCLGMAAQLAYYFFLSLFPALLIVVALTSVFPSNLLDNILGWFGVFTPADVLDVVSNQLHQIRQSGHAGPITFGVFGALWSSSYAMSAIVDTLNCAYEVKEARPRRKIQSLAIIMAVVMSVFVLIAFTLVVSGPEIAETLAVHWDSDR